MKNYIGQRLLVTVGDNDAPQFTGLRAISPNGLYGWFGDDCIACTVRAWVRLDSVKVLDVLGDIDEPLNWLTKRLGAQQMKAK